MIDRERFFAHVEIVGECWVWKGALRDDGLGRAFIGGHERRAHQVAWELRHDQPLPPKSRLLRTCRRPDCVRHWQRAPRLSEAAIQIIRSSSLSVRALGRRFKISHVWAWKIRRMKATSYSGLGTGVNG